MLISRSRCARTLGLAAPALAGCLAVCGMVGAGAADADTELGPPGGPRVYVSQACHNRGGPSCVPNTGCAGYDENAGSDVISRAIAEVLAGRGYRVRIGDGLTEDNIANSNAFAPLIHMPVHSNAGSEDCTSADPANGGTQVLHYGGPGDVELADMIVQEVGPKSPGTSDGTVVRRDLGEINQTTARAAYLESAYHTFGADVEFLRAPAGWAGSVADAVDRCLGRGGRPKECTWAP